MLNLSQVGETPRLTAIAELLEEAVQREQGRGTVLEARKHIHLVDTEVSVGQLSASPSVTCSRAAWQEAAYEEHAGCLPPGRPVCGLRGSANLALQNKAPCPAHSQLPLGN